PVPYPGDVNREKGDTVADAMAEGRILETYCEGDLVAYIFETRDERDTAAQRWEETREELTARILREDHNMADGDAEALAPAVLSEADDGNPAYDGEELRDRIATVMDDDYAGEWGSLADYVQDFYG